MAFKVSADAQAVFFQSVFGQQHIMTKNAKGLIAMGVSFSTGLYTVTATYQGKVTQVNLTVGTTPLMKGTVAPLVADQNKKLIAGWLADLTEELGLTTSGVFVPPSVPVPAPAPSEWAVVFEGPALTGAAKLKMVKAVMAATGLGLKQVHAAVHTFPSTLSTYSNFVTAEAVASTLKNMGAHVKVVEVPVSSTGPVAAPLLVQPVQKPASVKPVNDVLQLKDALALGQKVTGTSKGSVYYTIAIGEHVRLASKLHKSGAVSIRAEWLDGVPVSDLKKLEAAGIILKGGYGSIHFETGEVPLQRVVGAFLVGLEISWKAMVMNGADLVVAA